MTDLTREQALGALEQEFVKLKDYYFWLEQHMPKNFHQEISINNLMLIVHNLMEFESQGYYSSIHLKNLAIVMCLDEPDTDLKILKNYSGFGITSYQTYISDAPPPFLAKESNLHISLIYFFTNIYGPETEKEKPFEDIENLKNVVTSKRPEITDKQFEQAIEGISSSFLNSLPPERLATAIAMFARATTRDQCQYEVQYNMDWEAKETGSMQIELAWRSIPRHNFLYRLVRTIHRNGLVVKHISASYKHPYHANSIFVLAVDLHGANNKAVWEEANIINFIKEFITVKYFASFDGIDHYLVQRKVITGNMGNLLRSIVTFVHQCLVQIDSHLYSLENIEEAFCRHPELSTQLCKAFEERFDPNEFNLKSYEATYATFVSNVNKLDTGHEENDLRRKNIFRQAINFIHHCLKTNFYRLNFTALSFRLDPKYLDLIPFDRVKKFPELPYAIFFIKGMHFFGFHIRFRDLARGGLRTVFPEHIEKAITERNNIFTECYHLAYTQQMKNKDIPEGGAKGIIFLKPYERLDSEAAILTQELALMGVDTGEVERIIQDFRREQRFEHLYQAQRSFIENLMPLVNCDEQGRLRSKDIIDYWEKPEYLYLGPDENMHDSMIQWIAKYSRKCHYKPGSSFISGKPDVGINHKEYGVTSLGVNVYMDAILRFLGINPEADLFTIKMSGGPDGDVAGNQICNLYRYYPKTAKLLAVVDVSGTIYDPQGLDLEVLFHLFQKGQAIRYYPPKKLSEGGFLIDKITKKYETALVQLTLCWRMQNGHLIQDWLSGSDTNALLRNNVHQIKADIFIPGGGRPRTLNEFNYKEFLDPAGKPTARAIIEGANLYLTPKARSALEELGVLIVKDSSANKTGVICSSFEVLSGLTLGDEAFMKNKPKLVPQILERLKQCALNEATLLLETHKKTQEPLTHISDLISKRINLFKDQLLSYLDPLELSNSPNDPLIATFLNYSPTLLREDYEKALLKEIPEPHKKAIIACSLASHLVYKNGLYWFPSIVDILPVILNR